MSEATFEKHEYGTTRKYKFDDIEQFDPRPDDLKGKAKEYLPELLKKLDGKQLCLSLLFDETSQQSLEPPLNKSEMLEKVQKLKCEKLSVTEEEIRKIEVETKRQHNSPKWFAVRRLRLTSSMFGHVRRLQDSTSPDNLALQILGIKKAYGPALEYGRQTEEEARLKYTDYQIDNGHVGLFVSACGFHIHRTHYFLGASPDGAVYDPSSTNPFGFLEIKCAYKYQDLEPREAAKKSDFWLSEMADKSLVLKRNHVYYSQVQGHMACGNRPWCDFCTYTKKGIHVERIAYDPDLWEKELFPKLVRFYDSCIAPEIIAPQSALGLNIRDLRKE